MQEERKTSIRPAPPVRGSGPAVILLGGSRAAADALSDALSQEGYLVVAAAADEADIAELVGYVRAHPAHIGGIGLLSLPGATAIGWSAARDGSVDCAVIYADAAFAADTAGDAMPSVQVTLQIAGTVDDDTLAKLRGPPGADHRIEVVPYPDVGAEFVLPDSPDHDRHHAAMAYSRSVSALKRAIGPHYDLEELWEYHVACEFRLQDADAAMRTMVPSPYVNHVPTLTGGVGYDMLRHFYAHHFVNQVPRDRRTIPISRTIGPDRIVDEKVFCFTHDTEIDWLLPGVPPTGRYVEVPLVGIISFRGDKLINEHIYWDQASVLVQIGLLDPAGLPVAGIEEARKLLDPTLPSNALMPGWKGPAG